MIKNQMPSAEDRLVSWPYFFGSALNFALSQLTQCQRPVLLLCHSTQEAHQMELELSQLLRGQAVAVSLLPSWETLTYDHFSPSAEITSKRLHILANLNQLQQGFIIAPIATLTSKLAPKAFCQTQLSLKRGGTLSPQQLSDNLIEIGYRQVSEVMDHGEFAIRGALIDLFPMGGNEPFRIELFDDEIESIRHFDPETQRSLAECDAINCLSAHEYPLDDNGISRFRSCWRETFSGNPLDNPMYQQISEGKPASGAEYFLPFFFEQLASLIDYLPTNTLIVRPDNLGESIKQFTQEAQQRYEQLRHDTERPILPPEQLFLNEHQLFEQMKAFTQVKWATTSTNQAEENTTALPNIALKPRHTNPLSSFNNWLNEFNGKILICADSSGRENIIEELLQQHQIPVTRIPHLKHWDDFDAPLQITCMSLQQGFVLNDHSLAIVSENDLYAHHSKQAPQQKQQKTIDPELVIRHLTELKPGDPVVHIKFGVGRYAGLTSIDTNGTTSEYLCLTYADQDKIYVPIFDLNQIHRYTGSGGKEAPLHKLGSQQWQKTKEKSLKKMADIAAELLEIHAKRAAKKGHAFKEPGADYQKFADAFPFEESEDQKNAIAAIIQDMTNEQAMDRLICGDVGFGKTEVAMRAAFLAVASHKQVAMLVPTTLLASQHTKNLQDRFADWPIRIACLSRFNSPSEEKAILNELAKGEIDIVVGTHKLLQQPIKYKNLGLLIVDEEHRFGVKQKEKLKALKAEVDILTLTATPIPRTLNMAMSGVRDLSLISTPPAQRLAVKTFVKDFNETLVKDAILRETNRGGQVFFLHNKVQTIENMRERLQKLLPQAKIIVAHGQMPERQLEQIMQAFYHQQYHVLLTTTIIESGIDIPTANTILINDADRFGLAQLHQLRGRVGRAQTQAYAYLLTAEHKKLTTDAKKRLDAIANLTDLGAGFMLATHDLEIRGAGEILGDEQSGQIDGIGYQMYMELLSRTVEALKSGEEVELGAEPKQELSFDLGISALLPERWIGDVHLRLVLYKRLSAAENEEMIAQFKAELIDRFGKLPEEADNLIQLTRLKLIALALGINKVSNRKQTLSIEFKKEANIDVNALLRLVQVHPDRHRLIGNQSVALTIDKTDARAKLDALRTFFEKIALKEPE